MIIHAIFLIVLPLYNSFFTFNPERKWLFSGSFKNKTLAGREGVSSLAYFSSASGQYGTFGRGAFDGTIYVVKFDEQTNLYVAGNFTHMQNTDGNLVPLVGPIAVWPYSPFMPREWVSPFNGVPITWSKNDLYSTAKPYPVIYDISTDCANIPVDGVSVSCDIFIGGEFKVSADTGKLVAGTGGSGYTYNVFKWDVVNKQFDFLSPQYDEDYMQGPVKSLYKKPFEAVIFTAYHTDKKLWIGGDFPFGLSLVTLWTGTGTASDPTYGTTFRLGIVPNTKVNTILYRFGSVSDEIWVGGKFKFTTKDGKLIKNIANFNHKHHQDSTPTPFNSNTSVGNGGWENWDSENSDVDEWPDVTDGIGVTTIGYNGYDKYIGGWDLNMGGGNEPWQGLYMMKQGEHTWSSPNEAFDFRGTFIKKIYVCDTTMFACSGGSIIIAGGGGYVKYYNTDRANTPRLENFGGVEHPFGEDDVLEFVGSAYTLAGSVNTFSIPLLLLSLVLLYIFM